jgi:GNAT superfamily N-acetyltransferase
MDDAVVVRQGSVHDVAALAHLRYSWRHDERGERGLDKDAFETALRTWLAAHEASHLPFLALRDGSAVGMTWMALVDRVPGPEHFVRRSAYVQSTYVTPPDRNAGVGAALVGLLIARARELGLEYLAVHPSEQAFSLYRRLGFVDSGKVLELRF